VIGRVGTGITGIDVDYATRRGIIVTHTPDSTAVPAAELTLLHMLALCRRLPTVHHAVQDGWWLFDRQQQVGSQLHRKTVGLIGLGRVGKPGCPTLPSVRHDCSCL
jgi:D-3-phosphoglycerate dehydrogenase